MMSYEQGLEYCFPCKVGCPGLEVPVLEVWEMKSIPSITITQFHYDPK